MNLSTDFVLAALGRQTALVAALEREVAMRDRRIAELESAKKDKKIQ